MIDLASLAAAKAAIEFQESWKGLDIDFYAEPGMRARIVRAEALAAELLRVTFDFSEFEAHNRSYESADWYGRDGKLTTAREAGYYAPIDTACLPARIKDEIAPLSSVAAETMKRWQASGTKLPYIAWLEHETGRLHLLVADLTGSSGAPDSENPDMENADPDPAGPSGLTASKTE